MANPETTLSEVIDWRPIESLLQTEFPSRNVTIALWSPCDGLNTAWLYSSEPDCLVASRCYTHWARVRGPEEIARGQY